MSISRILNRLDDRVESYSSARQMVPRARKVAALRILDGCDVTKLAADHHVSRKFLYDQQRTAIEAIDAAFKPRIEDDERVLFTVKVTKTMVKQMVLALVLRCHSSLRGVLAFLADVFSYEISLGTVHNIVAEAIWKARLLSRGESLRAIKLGAHDEIYQAGRPVLAGVDCQSTYCYLLEVADSADSNTWGYHLLAAADKGLDLDYVVADQGGGQRRGLAEAMPHVPCGSDVFHVLRDFSRVLGYFENIHKGAYTKRVELEKKSAKAQLHRKDARRYSLRLGKAHRKERDGETLVDDLTVLLSWLREDILAVGGMTLLDRKVMYDFVAAELKRLEVRRPKVAWLRRRLENAKPELLGFVARTEDLLCEEAKTLGVAKGILDKASAMLGRSFEDPKRYEIEAELRRELHGRFYDVVRTVERVLKATPRASSIVESLNSILRSYFFLRREVGGGYLDLLRFFLNHRVIEESDVPAREGKTPHQMLTGVQPIHWLELLGFERYRQAA